MRRLLASVFGIGVLFSSLPSDAQDTTVVATEAVDPLDEAEARSHFDAGYAYFQEARYEDALREFDRAYDLSPRPALLFNMSQCYERLGRLDEAIRYLERFIGASPPPSDRPFQERRLANLRARQEDGTTNDEEPVELIAPDSARDVAATNNVSPPSEPLESVAGVSDSQSAGVEENESSGRALAYTFLGVGAAGLITMGVAGGLALSEKSRLQTECVGGCPESETTSLRTRALVADIGLAVGIAGGLVGLVLLLTAGRDDDAEARTQVAPAFGPNLAGATLHVRY
ncbi:MAG: tol-pal system YbgF family protein [Polyangiales bacterium]